METASFQNIVLL